MKLTFWDRVMGYKYIINTHTQHIHRLEGVIPSCSVDKMKPIHKWKITEHEYSKFMNTHTNLHHCPHCFKHLYHGQ